MQCNVLQLSEITLIPALFCLMFIQHTAFLLNKGSQDRRGGILPPAVSNYCYGLLVLVYAAGARERFFFLGGGAKVLICLVIAKF